MKEEQLSALVDGELEVAEIPAASGKLSRPEALAKMELYYRIGEELRADSAKASLGQEFSARLATALAVEPPHAGPVTVKETVESQPMKPETSSHSELEGKQGDAAAKQSVKQHAPGLVA